MALCKKCGDITIFGPRGYCDNCIEKYPEVRKKRRAGIKKYVRECVAKGKIKRNSCEICGSERSGPHVMDYSKPADVKWLCVTHRREQKELEKDGPVESTVNLVFKRETMKLMKAAAARSKLDLEVWMKKELSESADFQSEDAT